MCRPMSMVFCTSVYAVYVFSKRDLWNLRSCIIFSHLKKSFHFLILISKADVFFKPKTSQQMALENSLFKRNLNEVRSFIQGVNDLGHLLEVTNNQFLEFGSLNNSPFVGKVKGHVLRIFFFVRTFFLKGAGILPSNRFIGISPGRWTW